MKERFENIIAQKKNLVVIYALFALAAGILSLAGEEKTFPGSEKKYTSYNNYIIFEKSFHHLKNNQDLYVLHTEEHWDLYKYTPTFSVFFGLFAIFPDWVGLNLWNLLNAFVLLFAVYYLPRLNNTQKGAILAIVLIELMTSMQNEQSNGLIAGLLVFAFGLLENKKYFLAIMCIVFSAFIKLFGIVGLVLLLFYPQKWKLALYTIACAAILFLLPLLFIDTTQYIFLYKSYMRMLAEDHSASYGLSVMGWLDTWFGLNINKNTIVLAGVVIFLIPFIKLKQYQNYTFRLLALSSVLIWIVIFNHKAESPTFIIAMTGVATWYIISEKSLLNSILFICAFVFVSLSPTDIFPRYIRNEFVIPYVLKAFPCILIWGKIIYDMLALKNTTDESAG